MNSLFRNVFARFPARGVRNSSRAVVFQSIGEPLRIDDSRRPNEELKSDELNIQIDYCSLNNNDVRYMERGKHPVPYTPGYEFSGEILDVGSDVDDFQQGQRVVGLAPDRCGALATDIVLKSKDIWTLPSEISNREAAALICGHSTALLAFTEKRPIHEGDTVLIIAGPGGFGLAAVDVAAGLFKAKVIALSDTEGKASLLRDRGAYAAFKNDLKHNYKEIMSSTEEKGVDLIYDAVGGPILNTVVKCLKNKENGRILTTYNVEDITTSEVDEKNKISEDILKRLQTISLTQYREEDHEKYYSIVEQVLQFSEEGIISAHISKDFNLKQINEAIDYIKGKQCTGKVIIRINNDDDDDNGKKED